MRQLRFREGKCFPSINQLEGEKLGLKLRLSDSQSLEGKTLDFKVAPIFFKKNIFLKSAPYVPPRHLVGYKELKGPGK